MSHLQDRASGSGTQTVLDKIKKYGQKAGELGHRARKAVFGFRSSSGASIDQWSLPVKLLQRHRILQRRRAFHQAGGAQSSMAQHALKKARQNNT